MIESRNICKTDLLLEELKSIESLTPIEIESILERAGIKRNSDDYQDYELAKHLIFNGQWVTPEIYNHLLNVIADYLGV
ncbi:hypothetical protein GTN42_03895 [bacterium]|nr:hypothetical protein [bacterium]